MIDQLVAKYALQFVELLRAHGYDKPIPVTITGGALPWSFAKAFGKIVTETDILKKLRADCDYDLDTIVEVRYQVMQNLTHDTSQEQTEVIRGNIYQLERRALITAGKPVVRTSKAKQISTPNDPNYSLVFRFPDQHPSFARGFVCGQIWQRMRSGAVLIEETIVTDLKETVIAMATAAGYDEQFTTLNDDYLSVELKRG